MKTILTLLSMCIFTLLTGTAHAAEGENAVNTIIITRKGSVEAVKGPETAFTGDVSVAFLAPRRDASRLSAGLVTFQPGARSNWHTHPYGQLLIITQGKGRVREWEGPVQEVFPGDLVWFPAGVRHWHGAAPDQAMSHYSIQEEQDGKAADWMERVTDGQYNGV